MFFFSPAAQFFSLNIYKTLYLSFTVQQSVWCFAGQPPEWSLQALHFAGHFRVQLRVTQPPTSIGISPGPQWNISTTGNCTRGISCWKPPWFGAATGFGPEIWAEYRDFEEGLLASAKQAEQAQQVQRVRTEPLGLVLLSGVTKVK